MNSAARTLIALVLGLVIGAGLRASHDAALIDLAGAIKPLGALWLTGLQMTLVPLIFTLVASGVSSWADTGGGGRTVGLALGVFAVLLLISAATGSVLMSVSLRLWPTPPGALTFITHSASQTAAHAAPAVPSVIDQIVGMVPANPVSAAASGAMTPLVVFALLLGLALTRIDPVRRAAVTLVLQGVADAMMVLVDWVLKLAPIGIFVLALTMALNTGLSAAGALLQAVITTTAMPAVGIVICYGVARFGGGVSFARFAKAALGPQAVAAATTSSMATLPAMIEAAETELDCPPALAGAILPLAVSTFRFGNVILISGTAVFAAHAAGLQPSIGQIAVMALVVVLTNIGVVGLPAAAVLYAAEAPAFQAIGAPLALLPLLIALSAIPDIFDTVCNVTADLAATTVVRRFTTAAEPVGGALAAA